MKISRYIASYWNIVKYRVYRKKTVLLMGGWNAIRQNAVWTCIFLTWGFPYNIQSHFSCIDAVVHCLKYQVHDQLALLFIPTWAFIQHPPIEPMHNGASNEIKEIKACKKCPKVKPYCMPIFDPIMFKTFLNDAKLPKFCAKYFSLSKQSNIGCIFWICPWKIMKGCDYEIHTMYASCHVQKKN